MLVDYHLHTRFSDGAGTPQEYAVQARQAGLREYAHTDHQPLTSRQTDWHIPCDQMEAYVQAIAAARQEFPDLTIRMGIELEYWPGIDAEVTELQSRYPWDVCLGSVHFIDDFNFDNGNFMDEWARRDTDQVWADYFQLVAQAAQTGWYDSIAHPDLVKKFGFLPRQDPADWYEDFLDAAQSSGCALEINTGGLRKPCQACYPDLAMLTRACQRGIPVTFGSDAHQPADLGTGLVQGYRLAWQAGYRSFLRFSQRQPIETPLEEN